MPSLFPEPAALRPARSRDSQQHAWVNAHCDGGARGNPGPAGYGALIQDDEGIVLAELSEFLGHRTNNFAEYSGLLGCLAWALEHKHPRLRVVSDSELMVKQVQGKYKVNSPDLKPLWEEARRRIAKLEAFEISHALRHKNKDADRLANEAMDRGAGEGPKLERATAGGASAPVSHARVSSRPAAPPPVRSAAAPPPQITAEAVARARSVPGPEAAPTTQAGPRMLRGFTRGGSIQILGGAALPDGVFVRIIVE